MPPKTVAKALARLLDEPASTAIVSDYDGTLSPIVEDPDRARPTAGTAQVLSELARSFGVVAVVSGRSLSFLMDELAEAAPSVRMAGLYGLEQQAADGSVIVEPAAEPWVAAVRNAAERLSEGAPPGVLVEDKRLGVTVHWRRAPDAAPWAESAVRQEAARSGLRAQPGKMSLELRLPIEVDKGTALVDLVGDCSAACYLGDDSGDLPAFAALARLAVERGIRTVSIAVVGPETPPGLAQAADLVVARPEEALGLLQWLAAQATQLGGRSGDDR